MHGGAGLEASKQSTAPGPAGLRAGQAGPALRPQPGLPRRAVWASAPRGWLTNVRCLRAVCQARADEGSLRPLGCHPWQLNTRFPPRASLGVSGSPASVCLVVIALYHTSLHPCIRAQGPASWPPPATLPQGQVQCQAGPLPTRPLYPSPGVCCRLAHSGARGHGRPRVLAAISSSFQALRRCPKTRCQPGSSCPKLSCVRPLSTRPAFGVSFRKVSSALAPGSQHLALTHLPPPRPRLQVQPRAGIWAQAGVGAGTVGWP